MPSSWTINPIYEYAHFDCDGDGGIDHLRQTKDGKSRWAIMSKGDESEGITPCTEEGPDVDHAKCPAFFGQYINMIVTAAPCTFHVCNILHALHVVTLCPAFVGHLHD